MILELHPEIFFLNFQYSYNSSHLFTSMIIMFPANPMILTSLILSFCHLIPTTDWLMQSVVEVKTSDASAACFFKRWFRGMKCEYFGWIFIMLRNSYVFNWPRIALIVYVDAVKGSWLTLCIHTALCWNYLGILVLILCLWCEAHACLTVTEYSVTSPLNYRNHTPKICPL